MYREPGADLDLTKLATLGRIQVGEGRYETLIYVGQDEHMPMVTFTAPWGIGDVPLLSPSGAYLRMLGQGLQESHGWDSQTVGQYLVSLPGARGSWTAGQIVDLLATGARPAPDARGGPG